jgi:F-box interacting protein
MDDGETAPPAAQRQSKKTSTPHIPHELVEVILSHLPVESLLRFSRVCKAWRSTISLDASVKPCLLVSPQTLQDGKVHSDTVILYRWEDSRQGAALPVVHATDMSSDVIMHGLAHCDGLILLPSEAAVRVLNPATRRTLTLPWSPGAEPPPPGPNVPLYHQSFGFGHDPRSNAYKVARFFYRSIYAPGSGECLYTTGMEVFTIGTDQHWRETTKDPPYPVLTRHTATFYKGSLLWSINEHVLGQKPPGFLRFSLEDEAFEVMPPPPSCYQRLYYVWCALAEIRGELCLALDGADMKTIELWMCDNTMNPQWNQRYSINAISCSPPYFNPIAVFDDDIVFKDWHFSTRRYNLKTKTYQDEFHMKDLRYPNPVTGMLGYQGRRFAYFDVLPYTPSLVPI